MRTPMLDLFRESSEKKSTPHKDLRAEGWKKTGQSGEHHVYTHPEHVGHEIHLHPKTGAFEHKVYHRTSNLKKHLDVHTREAIYAHDRASDRSSSGWDRGREGYFDAPGPRGPRG